MRRSTAFGRNSCGGSLLHKLAHYPTIQTLTLLRRFVRHMPLRDVLHLLVKPLVGQTNGATTAEVISRAVEHGAAKSAAAAMTQLADEALERTLTSSAAERVRLDAEESAATARPEARAAAETADAARAVP